MMLSPIFTVLVSMVVVVPFTVKLPPTIKLPEVVTVTSVASPIVTSSVICGNLAVRFATFTLMSVLVTLASLSATLFSSLPNAARIVSVAATVPPLPVDRFVNTLPVIAVAATAVVNSSSVANSCEPSASVLV